MEQKKKFPLALVILDGFGHSKKQEYNAIYHAHTPNLDAWSKHYPTTYLNASGTSVGLLPNMIGNSEVGHLTIGAGRIIEQSVTRISNAIDDNSFFINPLMNTALLQCAPSTTVHIMGLLSDAGIHSHILHLFAFIQAVQKYTKNIVIHPFLDGRDTPPQSAARYLKALDSFLASYNVGIIGSIHGRFYAMDRDHNWQRTKKSYSILTSQQKNEFSSWQQALNSYYEQGITDEFISPTQLQPHTYIHNDDEIIFFNFRPDRARQLTEAFVSPQFTHFKRIQKKLTWFMIPTSYSVYLNQYTKVLFKPLTIYNTLNDVLAENKKTILSIAETEKYAHVTYFFNGMREKQAKIEERILIPSIPAKKYINYPEMSAQQITKSVVHSLHNNMKDFYLINYANADMVAHSGDFNATKRAIEYLDTQLGILYTAFIEKYNGTFIITSDHGNAEEMFDEISQQPKTAHTNNPVPFIFIHTNTHIKAIPSHGLYEIAPFILNYLQLPCPTEMLQQ